MTLQVSVHGLPTGASSVSASLGSITEVHVIALPAVSSEIVARGSSILPLASSSFSPGSSGTWACTGDGPWLRRVTVVRAVQRGPISICR